MGGTPDAATLNITFTSGVTDPGGAGTSRGVIPWAHITNGVASTSSNGIVTYDANGFRPLDLATEVTAGLVAGANSNLNITATVLPSNLSIQSLQFQSTLAATTISGGFNLTVTSGAFQFYNPLTVTNTPIIFPKGVTGLLPPR